MQLLEHENVIQVYEIGTIYEEDTGNNDDSSGDSDGMEFDK
jgi:hypothetical protein